MSKKIQSDETLQSTKQMLDELDALMDRMLSLPVSDAEEAPTLPEKPTVLSAKLTLLESPVTHSPLPALPPLQPAPYNPPHFARTPKPAVAPPLQPAPPPPAREPEPLTNEVVPPTIMPTLEPLIEETAVEAPPMDTLLIFLPLVWFNECFDRVAKTLPGGSVLFCSGGGRALLGFAGLVMSGAAGVWFLKDWLGWN